MANSSNAWDRPVYNPDFVYNCMPLYWVECVLSSSALIKSINCLLCLVQFIKKCLLSLSLQICAWLQANVAELLKCTKVDLFDIYSLYSAVFRESVLGLVDEVILAYFSSPPLEFSLRLNIVHVVIFCLDVVCSAPNDFFSNKWIGFRLKTNDCWKNNR